jgi:bifunctional non-homologous end joining protein LigD
VPRSSTISPPRFIEPQLSQRVDRAPEGDAWAHELKLDGYRLHARITADSTRLLTRHGLNWADRYRAIAAACRQLKHAAYIDGEICALHPDGTTSFADLQAATDRRTTDDLIYFAFDLLFLDGRDLNGEPLARRKDLLRDLLAKAPASLRYTEHVVGNGPAFYRAACEHQIEGIVSKRLDAPYRSGDRGIWVKTKCINAEEFVVVGFTDPEGSRSHFGALLVGYYDRVGRLHYAGRGGTGMSQRELKRLYDRMAPLATPEMPLAETPHTSGRFGKPLELQRVHWVEPELVVQVRFTDWTGDGVIRHGVYQGLREDKPAKEVVLDRPPAAAPERARPSLIRAGNDATAGRENIQRLLADAGVPSKDELRRYWRAVGRRALKYLARRPLVLVRHVGGKTFFHQRSLPPVPAPVHELRLEKREGGEGTRLWVDSVDGLLGLVDMDVVEVHPWGATVDDIEHPDLLVIDLDPGAEIEWEFVTATALALRDKLKDAGYASWCKTSGGKGLHVMVPIERKRLWNEARAWTKSFVEEFASRDHRYTTKADLRLRSERLFLDYLRNGRGTTTVGAYSPRARPGFPVSYPVTWAQVAKGIRPDAFTMADLEAKTASSDRKQ